MPDDLQTLADMAKINDMNARDAGATEIFNGAPWFSAMHAIESTNGQSHSFLKETEAPVVGFREVNQGREHDKSGDELVTLSLKILDASFHVDKMVAEIDKRRGVSGHMAREGNRHLRAAFRKAEEQSLYGVADDNKGFEGLADIFNALSEEMVIGAGGATANQQTSVWAVRTVPDETGVSVVLGNGNIEISEYFEQFMEDASGNLFPCYAQPIAGWLGLQIATTKSVARLANIQNSLDDDMISDLLDLFPEEAPATHLVMNKKARGLLRKSRTATNSTGTPAPYPDDAHNVPILTTSSVRKTEAVVPA